MPSVNPQRLEPDFNKSFVLFLVGFRVNKLWKITSWLFMFRAFQKIHKELNVKSNYGCLGYQKWFGRTFLSIQYWKNYDALVTYARDKQANHFPNWYKFNEQISKSSDIGLWHEIYVIDKDNFEGVYTHMPAFGLGKATKLTIFNGPKIRNKKGIN